jgi:alkylhydroperoxidase family enzyme
MKAKPRLAPIPPREWSATAREAMAILNLKASRIGLDPSDNRRFSNVTSTLFHHAEMAKLYHPFLKCILYEGTLPARYRELAILRVAWLRQAEYEWTQHVRIARGEGISDDEIRRLTAGLDRTQWDPIDAAVIAAATELIESAAMSDQSWNTLMPKLGVKGLIELIFVIGNYDMLAMFMNSARLDIEESMTDEFFKNFAAD